MHTMFNPKWEHIGSSMDYHTRVSTYGDNLDNLYVITSDSTYLIL
jgi:hypothetical protein